MMNVYDRNHKYLRSGDDVEIAGFENELVRESETENYGSFKEYNEPMIEGEEREVVWVAESGERTVVGYVEFLGEEEGSDDDE